MFYITFKHFELKNMLVAKNEDHLLTLSSEADLLRDLFIIPATRSAAVFWACDDKSIAGPKNKIKYAVSKDNHFYGKEGVQFENLNSNLW